MKVLKQIPEELDRFEGDLLISVVGEDERPLMGANAWIDWRLYGTLTDLIARGIFSGRMGEKCLLPTYGRFAFDRVVMVGGGPLFEMDAYPTVEKGQEQWREIARVIAEALHSLKVERVGLSLPRFELADQERALLKTLQTSRLPESTSLFISRAPEMVA